MRPTSLICYICGRGYGTASLGIHLKTCKRMFLKAQENKPKRERRKLPPEPPGLAELLGRTRARHLI